MYAGGGGGGDCVPVRLSGMCSALSAEDGAGWWATWQCSTSSAPFVSSGLQVSMILSCGVPLGFCNSFCLSCNGVPACLLGSKHCTPYGSPPPHIGHWMPLTGMVAALLQHSWFCTSVNVKQKCVFVFTSLMLLLRDAVRTGTGWKMDHVTS